MLLPAPDKRKKRGARRGASTDTDTDAEAATVAAAAAAVAIRGGAADSDVARSDGMKIGPVDKQAIMKSAKPTHGQRERSAVSGKRWNG